MNRILEQALSSLINAGISFLERKLNGPSEGTPAHTDTDERLDHSDAPYMRPFPYPELVKAQIERVRAEDIACAEAMMTAAARRRIDDASK